jgi:hypothetical protein
MTKAILQQCPMLDEQLDVTWPCGSSMIMGYAGPET